MQLTGPIRLVELVAALSSLADLTMGQPQQHSVRAALLAVHLARLDGAVETTADDALYVTLLRWSGCTANAADFARLLGDDIGGRRRLLLGQQPAPPRDRLQPLADAHCETAQAFARRLGLGDAVVRGLGQIFERWDGTGAPYGLAGEAIEPCTRYAVLASDVEALHSAFGLPAALQLVMGQLGGTYAPIPRRTLLDAVHDWDQDSAEVLPWSAVLAAESVPRPPLGPYELRLSLETMADFGDLKVPCQVGHARTVATYARAAGARLGLDGGQLDLLEAAALTQDLGRVGISNAVWEVPRSLTELEREAVQLHVYHGERALHRVFGLTEVARLGSWHHERLDGSGYYRQATAADPSARVLAAADLIAACLADRPHRPALDARSITSTVAAEVHAGRLDHQASREVLDVAGAPRLPAGAPGGLTEREAEVLALAATGLTNAQVASRLHLSPKTVSRHLENTYAKLGVHTRAGATVAALSLGLLGG